MLLYREFVFRHLLLFPETKQSFCHHRFTDDRKVETLMARRMVKDNRNFYQELPGNLVLRRGKWLSCGRDYVDVLWDSKQCN
jgi:hypothetical protein